MKNIYQSVLDDASEKRQRFRERGWEPSERLTERVREYRREREAREAKELLNGKHRR